MRMNSIVFAFDDDASDGDALLVANTGAKFTRKGVVSICNMDLSAKTTDSIIEPDDGEYDNLNTKLICSILEKRIKEYEGDINRLKEDANREKGVRKSCTGRFVWELLQNADDAMNANRSNANLIGAKGIGFKSVLELTDEPEIYSGDFCFHFSRRKSQEMLEGNKKWSEEMGIPVCRLPHPEKPGSAVQELLDEGYVTVLRLPLSEGKRETVEEELSRFCSRSLLFCQHIESVDMRIGNVPRHIKVQRDDEERVKLVENDRSTHWRVWDDKKEVEGEKRLSVRMCLPVIGRDIGCLEEESRLYVFFPTTEKVPDVYTLIHVSCEVEDNRQHLAGYQPHQDEICEMLAGMTQKILSKIPADVALRAFGQTQASDEGGMVTQLRNTIATTVQETAFIPLIGGGMAKPGNVRLWEHGLGDAVDPRKVQNQNLCHPDINNDEQCANILGGHDGLGAKRASAPELARFLQFCRNRTQEECLGVWNVAQSLMANVDQHEKDECEAELRTAPFWLVDNRKARSIDGEIPLVAAKPKDLPHWLSVDVIDKRFRELVQDEIKRHKEGNERWENKLSGSLQPPENKQGYFSHILLPYCEKLTPEEWQKNGWGALEMAFKWGEKDASDEPLIIDSGNTEEKQKRAEIFHLPVAISKGAQEWVPALQCYAGLAWGGPGIFDEHFASTEDRHVLPHAKDWKIEINDANKGQWKQLLAWLGCSWGWKIMQTNRPYRNRNFSYTVWHEDFYFEHFDEMFENPQKRKVSDCAPLLNVVTEMYGTAAKMKARYSYYSEKTDESSALRQLKGNEWLPCEKSLLFPGKRLFKPGDAYLPGFDLDGLLPKVNYRSLDGSAPDEVKEALKKLGAKDGDPNAPQLIDYMNRLSDRSEGKPLADIKWAKDDKGKIARAAKAIFSKYAKIENRQPLTGDVEVPCLRHTQQGEEIYFEKADNVCWADKSYFDEAEVRREILKTDKLHVFFRFLQDGEAFGLNKLSEHLRLEPQYGGKNLGAAEKLRERYDSRRVGMAKATGQELPKQLKIVAYDSIALKATEHAEIKIPKIKFWERSKREVAINAGADMWQGLAAALGELANGSQYKPGLELLLKEKTWKSFLGRLGDDYDLTEESIQEIEESAPFKEDNPGVTENDSDTEQEEDSDDSPSEPSPSNDDPRPPDPGPDGNPPLPEPQPETPDIDVVPNYSWGPVTQNGSSSGNDVDYDHEAREIDGELGEKALLKWLKNKFGDNHVTNMNEQNRNNPGYDIRVVENGEKHYYECKSFAAATPPRQINMTKAQLEKAKRTGNHYWLCVIYDLHGNPVKMLGPICNPAALESEPITTKYKVNLASRKSNPN